MAIVFWRSMLVQVSASGTSSLCTMTCGTMTLQQPPSFLTVTHDGKKVDVVAQATKFGFFMSLIASPASRCGRLRSGPYRKSDMPNEHSWPTQPFPSGPPPFARQKFTVDDINPYLDPEDKARIRDILLKASNDGIFTPPAYNRQTIEVPGENGGANQGSTAADPTYRRDVREDVRRSDHP